MKRLLQQRTHIFVLDLHHSSRGHSIKRWIRCEGKAILVGEIAEFPVQTLDRFSSAFPLQPNACELNLICAISKTLERQDPYTMRDGEFLVIMRLERSRKDFNSAIFCHIAHVSSS